MTILALETSCDDTCAAVLDDEGRALSNVISSQTDHERFGGVVPEIASRHHLELVNAIVAQALEDAGATIDEVDLVAATQGPGLVGALLVGLSTGKALAAARELPFAPVDHLQGHVAANFLANGSAPFEPPFVCLIASGGHTLLALVSEHDGFEVLGRTLDDAAGEAFDKGARMLGLGFPGGPALSKLARTATRRRSRSRARPARRAGRPAQAVLPGPRLLLRGTEDGAALHHPRARPGADRRAGRRPRRLLRGGDRREPARAGARALERTGLDRLAVGGGVAANRELRRRLGELGAEVHVPEPRLCTDNAAMIASAARYGRVLPYPHYLGLDAYATGEAAR